MTGRQLLRRPGYDIDVEKVLAACAEHSVAVEINANPWRLDLDWRWHELALKLGCFMSINPDAHSTRELDLTHWGVEMARKGGVPKDRVLNCLTREELASYLEKRRTGRRVKLVPPRHRSLAVADVCRRHEEAGRSPQEHKSGTSLIVWALPPAIPDRIIAAYRSKLHHSHRARIAAASAVSICSEYRV